MPAPVTLASVQVLEKTPFAEIQRLAMVQLALEDRTVQEPRLRHQVLSKVRGLATVLRRFSCYELGDSGTGGEDEKSGCTDIRKNKPKPKLDDKKVKLSRPKPVFGSR